MRQILIIISLAFISIASHAQDIITMKDGKRINAIVREVTPTLVRYNLYGEPNGVVIFSYKEDVSSILYQNGNIDTFAVRDANVDTQYRTETIQPTEQTRRRRLEPATESTVNTVYQDRIYRENGNENGVKETNEKFGIKFGLNSAAEIADNESTGVRSGFHVGLAWEQPTSEKVDIQLELVYSMQGGADGGGTDKIDYINFPIIFKIYTNKSRTFSIDLGPQLGLCISAKYGSLDYYDVINKFDVAFCLGISYKISRELSIGLRGNISFSPYLDGVPHRHSVSQLGMAYMF